MSINNSGGKGSARRPTEITSSEADENWNRIWGKKKVVQADEQAVTVKRLRDTAYDMCVNPDCKADGSALANLNAQYGKFGGIGHYYTESNGDVPITSPDLGNIFGKKKETIVGVAIIYDGVIHQLPAPKRHHHVIHMVYSQRGDGKQLVDEGQGFITSTGRYVSREDALPIARAAGQIIREPMPDYLLFSECMW